SGDVWRAVTARMMRARGDTTRSSASSVSHNMSATKRNVPGMESSVQVGMQAVFPPGRDANRQISIEHLCDRRRCITVLFGSSPSRCLVLRAWGRSMLISCWSVKGGSGTTVVAAAIALALARSAPVVLADFGGDAPTVL